jgi:hypothetical protein
MPELPDLFSGISCWASSYWPTGATDAQWHRTFCNEPPPRYRAEEEEEVMQAHSRLAMASIGWPNFDVSRCLADPGADSRCENLVLARRMHVVRRCSQSGDVSL